MTNLALAQCFGTNVVETATTIVISKADLLGLIPSQNNTADSLLAAIINTVWQQYEGTLVDQNGIPVTDKNSIIITYDNHLYYTSTWVQFWGYLFPINYLNSCFIFSEVSPYAD